MHATTYPPTSWSSSVRHEGRRRYAASLIASVLLHLGVLALFAYVFTTKDEPPGFAMETESAPMHVRIVTIPNTEIVTTEPLVPATPSAPRIVKAPDAVVKEISHNSTPLMPIERDYNRHTIPASPAARAWAPVSGFDSASTNQTVVVSNGDANIAVDSVAKPDYLRNPRPPYPRLALERGWHGTTLLRVEVRANGAPGAIEIKASSGYRVLDEVSVETVRKWKFQPARRNQRPVDAWAEVPITFMPTQS